MRKFFKIAGIILLNIILLLILLEIGFRLIGPSLPGAPGVAARWVTSGQPFAQGWTPAWQQNREHYWALRPGIDKALQYGSPTVSFHLSTIELWEGGGIGFRTDPVDFFVDAVVVGDSFGLCFTEREDCWVDLLAAQTEMGIVNLSQPVTGSRSHARILRDFGAPLQPPLVIWQFFGNDFNDDYGLAVFRDEITDISEGTAESTDETRMAQVRRSSAAVAVLEAALTGGFSAVPQSEQIFVKPYHATFGENGQHPLRFGSLYEQQALDMSRAVNQIGLGYSRAALREAQNLVAQWDGELRVIIMPTREEVYHEVTAPLMGQAAIDKLASAREAMQALCTELNLRCVDLYDTFREAAQQGVALYHVDDMHLNPQGNALLAQTLAGLLQEEKRD